MMSNNPDPKTRGRNVSCKCEKNVCLRIELVDKEVRLTDVTLFDEETAEVLETWPVKFSKPKIPASWHNRTTYVNYHGHENGSGKISVSTKWGHEILEFNSGEINFKSSAITSKSERRSISKALEFAMSYKAFETFLGFKQTVHEIPDTIEIDDVEISTVKDFVKLVEGFDYVMAREAYILGQVVASIRIHGNVNVFNVHDKDLNQLASIIVYEDEVEEFNRRICELRQQRMVRKLSKMV